MTDQEHFDLELQDLLDGRLAPSERARVQGHLDTCVRCREELGALTRGRDLARALTATDLPAGLAEAIRSRLGDPGNNNDPGHDAELARPRIDGGRRRLLAYAAGVVAAGIGVAVYLRGRQGFVAEAIQTYDAYRAGQRPLALTTSDTALLEQFFSRQLPFRTRVFDLAMMRYRLIGGRTDQLGGHQTALFVYTGPDDRRLLCQMYRGNVTELPQPTERRTHNGISFLIYSRAPHTVVFWPEGDIVCAVVSDMPSEDTIALAIAKAMKS